MANPVDWFHLCKSETMATAFVQSTLRRLADRIVRRLAVHYYTVGHARPLCLTRRVENNNRNIVRWSRTLLPLSGYYIDATAAKRAKLTKNLIQMGLDTIAKFETVIMETNTWKLIVYTRPATRPSPDVARFRIEEDERNFVVVMAILNINCSSHLVNGSMLHLHSFRCLDDPCVHKCS